MLRDKVFAPDMDGGRAYVLDVNNALTYVQHKPEWKNTKERGIRLYTWHKDDELRDVFMTQFGEYPSKESVRIDYREYLRHVSDATEVAINRDGPLQPDLFDHPNIATICRLGIEPQHETYNGWDTPGFFSGDSKNIEDLTCCWNLRACDIPLLFVDVNHLERYREVISPWGKNLLKMLSFRRSEVDRQIGVWYRERNPDPKHRQQRIDEVLKPFKEAKASFANGVRDGLWNGRHIQAPTMQLGAASTLGVIDTSSRPEISFALVDKPFNDDSFFFTQMLVASLSFLGGLYTDEGHLLVPPYIPELNEFYSRNIHFDYEKLRSESDRIGLIIDACDSTVSIRALTVASLVEHIFDLAGYKASLSSGGLIARQLITQLGGVDGARAFKIPGVRRLLKTHGPSAAFTRKSAVQLIASKDPENPSARFADYENLYGGHHPFRTKLDASVVFSYLVEKGLFRMGAELKCPHCQMKSWTALDALTQRLTCEMCGREFDATRQLIDGTWHYRRSGVLGAERNAQGAIPVVLTLQQFRVNLSTFRKSVYYPSLDLVPKEGVKLPKCETDFVWIIPEPYPDKTVVIIGECKDRGGRDSSGEVRSTIDAKDVENLRAVADALPGNRFSTFIVLAKLCPFTPEEIETAKTLNDQYRRRVILLTDRELEPYHFYERTATEFKNIRQHASTPEELANNTALIYFQEEKPSRAETLRS